jgi:origin recognition complex subunit 1
MQIPIQDFELSHKMVLLTPRQKRNEKAARAKKLLSGASLRKSDLDDEEQEWEWIYGQQSADNEDNDDSSDPEDEDNNATPRKRRRRNATKTQKTTIVGAKKGSFSCKVGDTVLVHNSDVTPWVAVICTFEQNTDGDMMANFLCGCSTIGRTGTHLTIPRVCR